MTKIDWTPCDYSDLPRWACDHCGAHPGNRGVLQLPPLERTSGVVRPLFADRAPSLAYPEPLHLRQTSDGTCACGKPTRDNAYGCEECADELTRILGDVPWLAEQLDLAVTAQRGKTLDASRGDDGLPWNEAAATTLAELRNELVTTIRVCIEDGVRHQSAVDGWPDDTLPAMSRWLLWRVDGLTRNEAWTDTLRTMRTIEGDTLRIIDNPPARLFLGWCKREVIAGEPPFATIEDCSGPVYAREGAMQGKCQICKAPYPVEASREALTKALDDRLCTAAEIARLTTYLGLHVGREQVRKTVNAWHRRKRITAGGIGEDGEPTFRYGAVRVLLSLAYEDREA